MKEDMRLAFQGIWLHKLRSFLTILGIVIGIASIIAIVSTIKGTNEQMKEALVGSKNNVVEVVLGSEDYEEVTESAGTGEVRVPLVSDETIDKIKEQDHVKDAATYLVQQYADGINYKGTMLNAASLYGVTNDYLKLCGYELTSGRFFTDRDISKFRKVIIIDQNVVSALFPNESPVGKVMEIKGEPFQIIGIVKENKGEEITINSLEDYYTFSEQNLGRIFMPQSTWPVIYRFDEPQNVAVKAERADDMNKAGKEAADLLNQGFDSKKKSYKAVDALETIRDLQKISEGTNKQLLWIASISLLVGGIGVMNIMLVSVTERTREIGLKKAIGAKKKRILVQFLTESAVLGVLGGILGVVCGIVLAYAISRFSGAPIAISAPAAALSVIFSMVIGIVFGLLPSVKAANLNPIDALRRE